MNRLKSVLAVAAGVIVGMAAGVLMASANRRLTINIDDSRSHIDANKYNPTAQHK